MAVKHINPSAKEESGFFISVQDTVKVMAILSDKDIAKNQFERSKSSLSASLKSIQKLTNKKSCYISSPSSSFGMREGLANV